MVISDEKVEEVLTTIQKMMEQMTVVMNKNNELEQKNSDLHKEMIDMLKSTARHQEWIKADDSSSSGSVNEVRTPHSRNANIPKPERPTIEEGCDDFGWKLHLDKWNRFKSMCNLSEKSQILMNLRESCSTEINRLLFQYVGEQELNSPALTEEKLLAHIKSVAVQSIHTEVHRWHFNQLEQQDSEPATKFVGRLKAQAALCKFQVQCSCSEWVSYDEEMVSQRLTSGVQNPEHQRKILGEAEKLVTLSDKVERLISLETTDDATDKIRAPALPTRSAPAKSTQYRRDQKQAVVTQNSQRGRSTERRFSAPGGTRRRCRGCGRQSHGEGKSFERKDCPAFGQTCNTCKKMNHFSKVCMKRDSRASFAKAADGGDTSMSESESDSEEERMHEHEMHETTGDYSFHYSAQAEDFRRRHPPGQQR